MILTKALEIGRERVLQGTFDKWKILKITVRTVKKRNGIIYHGNPNTLNTTTITARRRFTKHKKASVILVEKLKSIWTI